MIGFTWSNIQLLEVAELTTLLERCIQDANCDDVRNECLHLDPIYIGCKRRCELLAISSVSQGRMARCTSVCQRSNLSCVRATQGLPTLEVPELYVVMVGRDLLEDCQHWKFPSYTW